MRPDRQMIVHGAAGAPVQVDTSDGVRVKAPVVDVRVPAARESARPARVDVPMVEPD